MDKEKYKETADSFSKIIKRFFMTIGEVLEKEYGIIVMCAGHILYLNPDATEKDVRASTFAMGTKEILRGIPHVLEKEIEAYFSEFEIEEIRKDLFSGFERIMAENKKSGLPNGKKPVIH